MYFFFLLLFKDTDFNKMFDGEICLADSATTHMIIRNKRYFLNLNIIKANVNTISGLVDLIEGTGRAMVILAKVRNLIFIMPIFT